MRQEELLEELKALMDQGFRQAKAEWDHNIQNWSASFDQAVICVIDGRYRGAL